MKWLIACVLVTLVLSATVALADEKFVDPQQWISASGQWVLEISPSDPEGAGAATYRMTRDGAQVWSGELPYSLREACISDAGAVIGYAYDSGYEGWDGNMLGLVIDPAGEIIRVDAHKRDGPRLFIDPPPPGEPRGAGVMLDEARGIGVIRSHRSDDKGHPSTWWIYNLASGETVKEFSPSTPELGEYSFAREIDAQLVPGTPFVLVHWYVLRTESARFDLVDPLNAEVLWTLPIDGEYAGLGEDWRWWDLAEGEIDQTHPSDSEFSVVSYSLGQRVSYALERDGAGGWVVREIGRAEDRPVSGKAPIAWDPTPIELEQLEVVQLQAPQSDSPIRNILQLTTDGEGRLAWVRRAEQADEDQRAHFMLVEADGTVVRDLPLALSERENANAADVAWLGAHRWLLARTYYGDAETGAEAWFLDDQTGELQAVPEFPQFSLEKISGTPDGGFVVLGRIHGNYTIKDSLWVFDAEGKPVRSETTPGYGQGDSYDDFCVLSDGTVATLKTVRPKIKIWREPEPVEWDLEQLLGGGFLYVASMKTDVNNGVVVLETHAGQTLHRINAKGEMWQTLRVRGPDGQEFSVYDMWTVAPDGRIWVSDHHRLYRLDEAGKADVALGGPEEGTLDVPVAVDVDREGRIYAAERGTAAIHVFSEDGERLRVLEPEAGSMGSQDALPVLRVLPDGTVRYRMNWDGPTAVFDAQGEFAGTEHEVRPGPFQEQWTDVPGAAGVWQRKADKLRLMRTLEEVRHRPSGAWLRTIEDAAASPDGSVVVLCGESSGMFGMARPDDPRWLCLFDRDGKGVAEIPVPGVSILHSVAMNDELVLLADHNSLLMLPLGSDQVFRWSMPGEENGWTRLLIDEHSGTWLSWESGARKLVRWKAPTAASLHALVGAEAPESGG